MLESRFNDDEQMDVCLNIQVSHIKDLTPLGNQYCAISGCQRAPQAAAGYALEDYINDRIATISGRLIGRIKHQNGFLPYLKEHQN